MSIENIEDWQIAAMKDNCSTSTLIVVRGLFADLTKFDPFIKAVHKETGSVTIKCESNLMNHTILIAESFIPSKYTYRYNIHTEMIPENEPMWWVIPPEGRRPKSFHVHYSFTDKIVAEIKYVAHCIEEAEKRGRR